MCLLKASFPMYSFSEKQWREAPGIGSPSFPISSTEMSVTVSAVSQKLMLLYV